MIVLVIVIQYGEKGGKQGFLNQENIVGGVCLGGRLPSVPEDDDGGGDGGGDDDTDDYDDHGDDDDDDDDEHYNNDGVKRGHD